MWSQIGGGMLQEGFNIANMGMQHDYQMETMEEAPAAEVIGLKNAGLNPMLAAGGMGGPFGGGMPQSAQINPAASAQGMASMIQAQASARQANAQADLLDSQNMDKAGQVVPMKDDPDAPGQKIVDWDAYFTGPYHGKQPMMNAFQLATNIQQGQALTEKIKSDIGVNNSEINVNNAAANYQNFNRNLLQAQYDALVRQAYAQANLTEANVTPAQAEATVMGGPMGVPIAALQKVLGIAGGIMGLLKGGQSLMNPPQPTTINRPITINNRVPPFTGQTSIGGPK